MILKRTQYSLPPYLHILDHPNLNRIRATVPLKNIAFGDPLLMFMKDYEIIHYSIIEQSLLLLYYTLQEFFDHFV